MVALVDLSLTLSPGMEGLASSHRYVHNPSSEISCHRFESHPRQLSFFLFEIHWLLWVYAFILHYPSCFTNEGHANVSMPHTHMYTCPVSVALFQWLPLLATLQCLTMPHALHCMLQ